MKKQYSEHNGIHAPPNTTSELNPTLQTTPTPPPPPITPPSINHPSTKTSSPRKARTLQSTLPSIPTTLQAKIPWPTHQRTRAASAEDPTLPAYDAAGRKLHALVPHESGCACIDNDGTLLPHLNNYPKVYANTYLIYRPSSSP